MDNCIFIICACELIMVKVNIYKIMSISQIASSYLLEHKTHLSHSGNLLYLLCLISNTMPQLEQSSLQPSTVLHHRHIHRLPATTISYSTSSSPEKKNPSSNRLGPPPPLAEGLRSQKGLRPFNPLQNRHKFRMFSHVL